ncbi:MAG: hypothetical protein WBP22_03585 [Candidatus Saccharimonas sp.]
MLLTLSVIAATATVCVVIWFIQWIEKRIIAHRAATEKHRRQAKVLKWVEAVESSPNHQTTAALPPLTLSEHDLHLDDERRETAARHKFNDAIYCIQSEELGVQRIEHPAPHHVAYLYLYCHTKSLDSWIAFRIDARNLGMEFVRCTEEALKRAREGDQEAIRGFSWLMSHQGMIVPFCKDFGIDPSRYSEERQHNN